MDEGWRSFSSDACRDLIEHAAVREVRALHVRPTAERLIHRDQRNGAEYVGVARERLRIARTEEVAGRDLLSFGRIEEMQIGLRNSARAPRVDVAVDDGDRRFRKDAYRRHDDLEPPFAELAQRKVGLVLPRN